MTSVCGTTNLLFFHPLVVLKVTNALLSSQGGIEESTKTKQLNATEHLIRKEKKRQLWLVEAFKIESGRMKSILTCLSNSLYELTAHSIN